MLLLSKRVFSCANLTRAASRYQHHHYVMPSRIAASGLIYFFPLLVYFFLFFLRCGYEVSIDNEFISVCSFYFFLDLIPFFCFYFTFEVFIFICLHISFVFLPNFYFPLFKSHYFLFVFTIFAVFFLYFIELMVDLFCRFILRFLRK